MVMNPRVLQRAGKYSVAGRLVASQLGPGTRAIVVTINSMALVREQTIPTDRSPLVGEVGANFCG
jgi:hypothetical protein